MCHLARYVEEVSYLEIVKNTTATGSMHTRHQNAIRHILKTDWAFRDFFRVPHQVLKYARSKGCIILVAVARELCHELLQLDRAILEILPPVCLASSSHYQQWMVTHLAHSIEIMAIIMQRVKYLDRRFPREATQRIRAHECTTHLISS
jgi:hypothetical protein